MAAARTGKIINIKKAQFLSGQDMKYPVEKVRETGNANVWLTERGNTFGYNNLVVDFRNIPRYVFYYSSCYNGLYTFGSTSGC